MTAFFFDSSALVKAYLLEVGSGWVRNIVTPGAANDVHVLRISEVETTSAIARRRKSGSLSAADAATAISQIRIGFQSHFIVFEVSSELLSFATALVNARELRAYDGVQLAAALALQRTRSDGGLAPITFISADEELNEAARSEGLAVENPNNYG